MPAHSTSNGFRASEPPFSLLVSRSVSKRLSTDFPSLCLRTLLRKAHVGDGHGAGGGRDCGGIPVFEGTPQKWPPQLTSFRSWTQASKAVVLRVLPGWATAAAPEDSWECRVWGPPQNQWNQKLWGGNPRQSGFEQAPHVTLMHVKSENHHRPTCLSLLPPSRPTSECGA